MRPDPDYIAQRAIRAPGTMVYGFQRGQDVPASTVENWDLVIGEDGDVLPVNTGVVARPAVDSDDRAAWEGYVIGQGTSTADARAMSLDDLRAAYDPADAEEPVRALPDATRPQRPADSDKKAVWVDYAIATGADSGWANASDTTKADLMNYQNDRRVDAGPDPELGNPGQSGDPIAEHASDLANG